MLKYVLLMIMLFASGLYNAGKLTGHLKIAPQWSVDRVFDLSQTSKDAQILLKFKARVDYPDQAAGYAPVLQIEVNGKVFYDCKSRLLNKPEEFLFGSRKSSRKGHWAYRAQPGTIEDRFGGKWALAFAPNFRAEPMKKAQYWPIDGTDPFVFVIDISDLVEIGEKNIITFRNFSHKYPVVIGFASIEVGKKKIDRTQSKKIREIYLKLFEKYFGRSAIRKEATVGREWVWDMKYRSNYSNNADSFMELANYEQALERCKKIKAQGFDAIMINGMHFRPDHFAKIENRILPYYKMFCRAAHEVGLKVFDHHDPTIFFYEGYPFANKHLDWLQRDLRYNTPKHMYCLNNPEYRKFYFNILKKFQRECHIDGYQLDEITFFDDFSCGCKYCRAAFKKDTGFDLPHAPNSRVYGNMGSDLWHLWRLWRMISINRFFKDAMEAVQEINPKAFRLCYQSSLGIPDARAGLSYSAFTALATGCENMSRVPFQDYRYCFVHDKLYRGFADAFGHASFILHYPLNDMSARFCWGLECATGNAHWMLRGNFDSYLIKMMQWKHNMRNFDFDDYGDVGILYSSKSQNTSLTRGLYHWMELDGWSIAMLENHIQYAVLYELGVEQNELSKYKLIVLPHVNCLDKQVAKALIEYVKNGGIVLTTGETALYNQFNRRYAEFTAPQLIPAEYDGYIQAPYDVYSVKGQRIFTFDRKRILYDYGKRFLALAPTNKNSKILYYFRKDNKNYPGIIETPLGQGRVINCAGFLGISNYAYYMLPGRKQIFRFNPDAELFMAKLIREVLGKRETIIPIDVPKGVRYSSFIRKGTKDEIDLHLLNVSDNKRVVDVTIKRTVPKFPQIKEPIIIGLRNYNVESANLYTSPNTSAIVCTIKKVGELTQITIPKDQLNIYGIVKIKLNGKGK